MNNDFVSMSPVLMRRVLIVVLLTTALTCAAGSSYEQLIKAGHYKQAKLELEKVLAANPRDGEAMAWMAFVRMELNDVEGATKLAEQAVALAPNSAQAHAILADCYGSKAENAGLFSGLKLAHAFRREADAALAIDAGNYEALHSYMQFYLDAPGIAGGSKSKAAEMAGRIAASNPSKGFLAQAEIAIHEKQLDLVPSLYDKAVEADSRNYEALTGAASIYAAKQWRNLAKAEDYARRAISLDPERAAGYGILGQVKALNEQWPELDEVMERAEKNVPDDFGYYYRLGRVLLLTGKDNPRAERYLHKFLSQPPEGDGPTLAHGHWQLGLVLEKEGRKQQAIEELQIAVQLDPDLKPAKKDLDRLRS